MKRFTIPRDIYYGKGSLSFLKQIKGKKAIIVVGGGSMRRLGFLDKVERYLREAGIAVRLIEKVEPDPSVETVLAGAAVMREFEPDWIISIGGGSAIDAAKAMWIFYEYPETKFEDITKPFSLPELRQKARFIGIPSTSGTATEVTAFSVITDYKTEIKYPLADFNITPDIAIVDPELAESMPAELTAHTGMDALTHALEAYVAGLASPFTDPLAAEAIMMVFANMEKSYKGDKAAREEMHYAQCLAGMAFSNALLGITHSMAHKTGAVFHIPHGCANAIYLPYVIAFNKQDARARAKYAAIARRLGLGGTSDEECCAALERAITDLNRKLNIPCTLKEYGIEEAAFKEKLSLISERALTDACTGANPRPVTQAEMEKLFACIYYGACVDF